MSSGDKNLRNSEMGEVSEARSNVPTMLSVGLECCLRFEYKKAEHWKRPQQKHSFRIRNTQGTFMK